MAGVVFSCQALGSCLKRDHRQARPVRLAVSTGRYDNPPTVSKVLPLMRTSELWAGEISPFGLGLPPEGTVGSGRCLPETARPSTDALSYDSARQASSVPGMRSCGISAAATTASHPHRAEPSAPGGVRRTRPRHLIEASILGQASSPSANASPPRWSGRGKVLN